MARLLALLLLASGLATPANAQPLALRDVTVVDVTDGTLVPGRTVLIDGARIAAIGRPMGSPCSRARPSWTPRVRS